MTTIYAISCTVDPTDRSSLETAGNCGGTAHSHAPVRDGNPDPVPSIFFNSKHEGNSQPSVNLDFKFLLQTVSKS